MAFILLRIMALVGLSPLGHDRLVYISPPLLAPFLWIGMVYSEWKELKDEDV